jgi:rhamnosyltransferase
MTSVDIILAVKNGEEFLQTQLDTIYSQNGQFKIKIICGLDLSSDRSEKILKMNKINFVRGGNSGPAENFLNLLQNSNSDYAAFSDQDDIWYPDKIQRSLTILSGESNAAVCVGSFHISTGGLRVARHRNFYSSLLRNEVQGNTILMNSNMVKQLKHHIPHHVVMHDWWIYILARTIGSVYYDRVPTLTYRIHDKNTVGIKTFRARFMPS